MLIKKLKKQYMHIETEEITAALQRLTEIDDIDYIKGEIAWLINHISITYIKDDEEESEVTSEDDNAFVFSLIKDLKQIEKTQTLERSMYYIRRLIKSLTEVRSGKINDINLNRWKEYDDLLTDSLWLFEKRDSTGKHTADYWGNFIPQIPNQLLRRFTKEDELVLDTFLGSGTSLIECKRLCRNALGIELQENVANTAKELISKDPVLKPTNTFQEVIIGDSSEVNLKQELHRRNKKSFQLVIMHPPYWDIIKFSEDQRDLSNKKSIKDFLLAFGKIVDNFTPFLDKGRYLAVVIGDKYQKGELIPLGFLTMQEVLKRDYKLKSTIVKNFEDTAGKRGQKELWRYRALAGGYYIFKHEYIFLFEKR